MIGMNIKHLRKKNGFSQEDIAEQPTFHFIGNISKTVEQKDLKISTLLLKMGVEAFDFLIYNEK